MMPKILPQTILALDCSTDVLSLALLTPEKMHMRELAASAQSSQVVLHEIEHLLKDTQTPKSALELLVCGRGPGAFTGVRVAIAVMQGLAFAQALPVFAVSGLLAIAEEARMALAADAENWQVSAMLDARMGQVYTANCVWHEGRWRSNSEELLDYGAVAQVLDGLAPIMAGNVRSALGMANLPVPAALQDAQPSAAALLRVALQEIAAGVSVLHDPNALSPVYVRNKVAQTTAERAAQTQR